MQALLITQFKKMCNNVNMILTKTKGTSCSILVTYMHPKSCAKNCKQNNVWRMTVVAWYISHVEKFIIYFIKAVSTEVSWYFHCMPASSSWSAPFSAEEWMQGSCLLLHSVHCYRNLCWSCLYILFIYYFTYAASLLSLLIIYLQCLQVFRLCVIYFMYARWDFTYSLGTPPYQNHFATG
jgi:hypothetical protein